MNIQITMTLDPEYAEPEHPMGVTEEGHLGICDALMAFGSDIIVERAP